MTYLDSAILNALERVCRKFQVLTGRTNVWLAVQLTNLSIVVYFIWALLYFWHTDVVLRTFVGLFCGGLLYALTQTIFKVSIEEYEKSAYRRVAKGYRNPRRVRDAVLRMSFLTLAIVLGYPIFFVYVNLHLSLVLLSYLLVLLTTLLLYLLACDPLPPCAGKVREWLGGASEAPQRAESRRIAQ
jgi:signal transduction histidine kinase